MYGRLTRIKGSPDGLEESVRTFEKDVATPVRAEPGFRGLALMGNRQTGDAITIAYWEDRAAMEASAEKMKQIRAAHAAASGGKTTITSVETGEIVSMERAGDPSAGTFARINTLDAKPDQIDAAIATYKAEVGPLLKSLPGFRSVVMSVNRETGRVVVGSVWASEQERDASEARVAELRKKTATTAGAPRADVELFEIVFADIPAGARTGA
jgi:heme-degrading monooxygenase HmoA